MLENRTALIIRGVTSQDVNVTESLQAKTSSAGNVRYTGNPKYVDAHSSSAGSIRKR